MKEAIIGVVVATLVLAGLLGWSHTTARNGGRLEACAHVCGGDAEWATVGEGCVCLVREEVAGGAQ